MHIFLLEIEWYQRVESNHHAFNITLSYSSNKSTGEKLIHGNIKSNLKVTFNVHVLAIHHQSELKDWYQIRNIWHELQFTLIIHCAVLGKHPVLLSLRLKVSFLLNFLSHSISLLFHLMQAYKINGMVSNFFPCRWMCIQGFLIRSRTLQYWLWAILHMQLKWASFLWWSMSCTISSHWNNLRWPIMCWTTSRWRWLLCYHNLL